MFYFFNIVRISASFSNSLASSSHDIITLFLPAAPCVVSSPLQLPGTTIAIFVFLKILLKSYCPLLSFLSLKSQGGVSQAPMPPGRNMANRRFRIEVEGYKTIYATRSLKLMTHFILRPCVISPATPIIICVYGQLLDRLCIISPELLNWWMDAPEQHQ